MKCLSLVSMRRQGVRGKALDSPEQQLVQPPVGTERPKAVPVTFRILVVAPSS